VARAPGVSPYAIHSRFSDDVAEGEEDERQHRRDKQRADETHLIAEEEEHAFVEPRLPSRRSRSNVQPDVTRAGRPSLYRNRRRGARCLVENSPSLL
jgi:hypothetical protein